MRYFQKFSRTHTYRTLIRYFLSYFLLLSFLLMSFFFLVRNQLSKLYFEELSEQAGQQLETTSRLFKNGLLTIDQINSSLSNNINLILSRNTNDDWAQYQAYQEINDYSVGNSLIESIVYYDKIHDTVLSSGKYVEYGENAFHIYNGSHSTEFDPAQWLNDNTLSNQLLYITDNAAQYLIYYPYNDFSQKYMVFFILNRLEIQNMLQNVVSGEITSSVLITPDGQIAAGINSSLVEPHLSSTEILKGKHQLNSQTSLLIGESLHNGYAIAALVSNDVLMSQVKTAFQRTYAILVILCIAGILLILFAMRNTYLPLHNLTKKIVQKPNPGQGYLEQLDRAFTTALTENQLLQDKVNKYKLSMQKSILDSIITGSPSAVEEGVINIDPFFTMESDNHIFALRMQAPTGPFPYQEVAEFLGKALPREDTCIVLEADNDSAVFLLSYSGPEKDKDDVVYMLISDLHEEKGYLAALSNSSSSPLDIPSLYENAVLASSYWNQRPVVSFSTIAPELSAKTAFSYPYNTLEELVRSLKEHAFEDGRAQIQKLFQLIDRSSAAGDTLPVFFVRCVLIDLLTVIIHSMNQANVKFKSYSDLYFETLYFCRSCAYEEKKDEIQDNVEQLLVLYEAEYENKIINASQIQQLIEEHFISPDFSITILADTFHVSIAYMSYLFKKEMGVNFSDYVWALRLEKAKELLLTTNTPIDDISIAVGYLNTSSFRRKFKQATEMTPSQFRSGN